MVYLNDIALIFLPQWSPFQPAMALPALSAWLRKKGYSVSCIDANILLYEYLFSDEAQAILAKTITGCNFCDEDTDAYLSILNCRKDFYNDVNILRRKDSIEQQNSKYEITERYFLGLNAFSSYLSFVSKITQTIKISPYDFAVYSRKYLKDELQEFSDTPPEIINYYLDTIIVENIKKQSPKSIGLSCIGQDQLPFALLFGRKLKENFDVPIIIGGTMLPRLQEAGRLPKEWFGKYFDILVYNEGELPCEAILKNICSNNNPTENTPNTLYLFNNKIIKNDPAPQLKPSEMPTPDYSDLDFDLYFSPEICLPMLTTRGCYWGKCSFCRHGLLYGNRFYEYSAKSIKKQMEELSKRYKTKKFSFNDEAIPPKLFRMMGKELGNHTETGFTFSGVIRFEEDFKKEDFRSLNNVGCRYLYVGLESCSERVLKIMNKSSQPRLKTIERNLLYAKNAGIHVHCFLFFGFPGENESDAKKTYEFVIERSDIIGSYGGGTFLLEHGTDIQKDPANFGVILKPFNESKVIMWYDYEVKNGLSAKQAEEWSDKLDEESKSIESYKAVHWIQREHFPLLLSHMTKEEILHISYELIEGRGILPSTRLKSVLSVIKSTKKADRYTIINRMTLSVFSISEKIYSAINEGLKRNILVAEISHLNNNLNNFFNMI